MTASMTLTLRLTLFATTWPCLCAQAAEWHGELDLRLVATDAAGSWTQGGLGKTLYDNSRVFEPGRAVLRGEQELTDSITGSVVLSARDDRDQVVDVQEAWLGWNPLPRSAWRARIKAGAFFPAISREVGYDSPGWTPVRTLSSSAVNSWIGEELRTRGVELSVLRQGVFTGSRHDYGVALAVFNGNDPAGTLLAWEGWHIGDRVTGLSEPLSLPDLPVYRPEGAIPLQRRSIYLFREIDHRQGYYASLRYGFTDRFDVAVMHYDNRGDPLRVENGQYSWSTRFNHLGMHAGKQGDWELLLQALSGNTLMGPNAVHVDFRAWYLLVSHPLGTGQFALRYDRFGTDEMDVLPGDPNIEQGHAWTVSYRRPLSTHVRFISEYLYVDSARESRNLLGTRPAQLERSLSCAISYAF